MSIIISLVVAIYVPAMLIIDVLFYQRFRLMFVEKFVNKQKDTKCILIVVAIGSFAVITLQIGLLVEIIRQILTWLR